MKIRLSTKLKSLISTVVRFLRLDLLRALISGLSLALVQDLRLAIKHIFQDHRNRYAVSKEVLLSKLRTTSHILDKGLSCSPWEPGRGRTAYLRSQALVEQIGDEPRIMADPSYQWAIERLRDYENSQNKSCRDIVLRTPMNYSEDERKFLMEFIRSRRSTRHFRPDLISRVVLETIASAAHWAPCSCCRQPTVLHVTQQEDLVKKCLDLCAGATGFSGRVPCFMSVCADTRFYTLLDRHLPLIDASLGAESLLLAAHAYGLSGTALNWMHATPGQEETLRHILMIPAHERIVFNIALGYPETLPREPGYKGIDFTCIVIGT